MTDNRVIKLLLNLLGSIMNSDEAWGSQQLYYLGFSHRSLLEELRDNRSKAKNENLTKEAIKLYAKHTPGERPITEKLLNEIKLDGFNETFEKLLTNNGGGSLPKKRTMFSNRQRSEEDMDYRWIGLAVLGIILIGGTYVAKKRRGSRTADQKPPKDWYSNDVEDGGLPGSNRKSNPKEGQATVILYVAVSFREKLEGIPEDSSDAPKLFNDGTFCWWGEESEWKSVKHSAKLEEISDLSAIDQRNRIAIVFEAEDENDIKSRALVSRRLRQLNKENSLNWRGAYRIGVTDPALAGFKS